MSDIQLYQDNRLIQTFPTFEALEQWLEENPKRYQLLIDESSELRVAELVTA